MIAVYNADGTLKQRFECTLGNTPTSFIQDGNKYYITTDHLGSVATISDDQGNLIKYYEYDAWGKRITGVNNDPSIEIPIGFAGGLFDEDTGLIRFGYRDYDPEMGRWTVRDPIGFAGGDANLYGYASNDPVNFTDESGLCPWCIAAAVGAVVGATIDVGIQLINNGGNIDNINLRSVGEAALAGAAISMLGPTGALLGRGGTTAIKHGYNKLPGLLNRSRLRFGWSRSKDKPRDVLSLRTGKGQKSPHHDVPRTEVKSGAKPYRDGAASGVIGAGYKQYCD